MTDVNFMLGYPREFKNICLIYPPKVKDIVTNQQYGYYAKFLTLSQEEIEDEYTKNGLDLNHLLTPFEYVLNLAYNNESLKLLVEQAFYFFIHEKISFSFEKKTIIIGNVAELKDIHKIRFLKEEDYFDFQNMIREAIGTKTVEPPNPNEDPRVKAIKAKARYRDKIKAKKGKGVTLATSLSAICCMGLGLNPLNIGELSYAAVPLLIATYQQKEKYQIDIDSLLAGADSKKVKPEYWIKNVED